MPEKPEKLKLRVNAEDKQEQAVEEITDKYTDETEIEVEVTPLDMRDHIDNLDVEGLSGHCLDIICQFHDRIVYLVTRGFIDPVNISNKDEYTDTALDAVMYDDDDWGYPAVTETYTMYYNKSLVDEAPETMEEVMDIAEENTDA